MKGSPLLKVVGLCFVLLLGCGEKEEPSGADGEGPSGKAPPAARLSGTIRIDGPRILQPLNSAAARNFEDETAVEVDVAESGTQTALDKFCAGRIPIAGARRRMTAAERRACAQRGIRFERVAIANHVVAVVTSKQLQIGCLTMESLRELWRPGSRVKSYRQLDRDLPAKRVDLYGPKIGSDGLALFTSLVNGDPGAIRSRWETADNRSALTARVRRSSAALGFFNFAELTPISDIRLVAVDDGNGCVAPSRSSVQTGTYPLAERLYLYVSHRALERPRVRSFMQYFLGDYEQLTLEAPATVRVSERDIARARRRLPEAQTPAG